MPVAFSSKQMKSPGVFDVLGWMVLCTAFPMYLRMFYEETALTRAEGPQMLGFTVVHEYPLLLLAGFLGLAGSCLWVVGFLVLELRCRLTGREGAGKSSWVLFSLLSAGILVTMIPYPAWQWITLETAGPGPGAGKQLVAASMQDEQELVEALVRRGVAVDYERAGSGTALEAACANRHVEVARFLIERGASLERAPSCREIVEFRVKMKPLEAEPSSDDGRIQVPATTVHVH